VHCGLSNRLNARRSGRVCFSNPSNGFLLRGLQVRILLGWPTKTLGTKGFLAVSASFFRSIPCCVRLRDGFNDFNQLPTVTNRSTQHGRNTPFLALFGIELDGPRTENLTRGDAGGRRAAPPACAGPYPAPGLLRRLQMCRIRCSVRNTFLAGPVGQFRCQRQERRRLHALIGRIRS
jgi:hypothetical protein